MAWGQPAPLIPSPWRGRVSEGVSAYGGPPRRTPHPNPSRRGEGARLARAATLKKLLLILVPGIAILGLPCHWLSGGPGAGPERKTLIFAEGSSLTASPTSSSRPA